MAETYGFYNNVSGDREYQDEALAAPFGAIVGTAGVVAGTDEELEPHAGSGLQVIIDSGFAFGGHTPGWWYQSTEEITKTLDAAETGYKRIDEIVLRFDRNLTSRSASIEVIKGEEVAGTPIAPATTQNETVYELPLCQVLVDESTITNLTDKRVFAFNSGTKSTIGIANIAIDTGVVKGDFIYEDAGTWKLASSANQSKGTHIYDGVDAIGMGLISHTSSSDYVGYSLYVQSTGKLGITITDIHGGYVLSTSQIYVNFNPANARPKAYLDNMIDFIATPGKFSGSAYANVKFHLPAAADGAMLRFKDTAWAEGDDKDTGTLIATLTDDTDLYGNFKHYEAVIAGKAVRAVVHIKAFPYADGLYNDTIGVNEVCTSVGMLKHEYNPANLSGSSVVDSLGALNGTATNITKGSGTGKLGDSFDVSGGHFIFGTHESMDEMTALIGFQPTSGATRGLFSAETINGYRGIFGMWRSAGSLRIGGDNDYTDYSYTAEAWDLVGVYYTKATNWSYYIRANGQAEVSATKDSWDYTRGLQYYGRSQDYISNAAHAYNFTGKIALVRTYDGHLTNEDWANIYNSGDWQ